MAPKEPRPLPASKAFTLPIHDVKTKLADIIGAVPPQASDSSVRHALRGLTDLDAIDAVTKQVKDSAKKHLED